MDLLLFSEATQISPQNDPIAMISLHSHSGELLNRPFPLAQGLEPDDASPAQGSSADMPRARSRRLWKKPCDRVSEHTV